MRKVLIPTKLDKVAANLLTEHGYEVVFDTATPMDELIKRNPDAEVLIVRSENVTPEVIDALPKLKLVVRAGAGFNTIDIKYARKRDVDVMNTPGANSNGVAEEVGLEDIAVHMETEGFQGILGIGGDKDQDGIRTLLFQADSKIQAAHTRSILYNARKDLNSKSCIFEFACDACPASQKIEGRLRPVIRGTYLCPRL